MRKIISRHPGQIAWLKAHGWEDAEIISHNAGPSDLLGAHVCGNLPLHLASLCESITVMTYKAEPPKRGEYTKEHFERLGCKLRNFKVTEIQI